MILFASNRTSNLRTVMFRVLASLVLLCAALVLVAPVSVQAEDPCECYCAVPKSGATKVGNATSTDCAKACDSVGLTVAACAYDPSQRPDFSVSCFKESQCANQSGTLDTSYQPAECIAGMHYCYPTTDIEVELNVAIGSTTSLSNYGQYVEVAYQWMLGASVVFSIIMIMIGGLQYTLAAGGTDTSKAKKRIKNAIMGLVLLMSAYAILYTVNPQLIRLQVPKLPLIRTIQLAGDNSCGYLLGKWGSSPYHTWYGAPDISPHNANSGSPEEGEPYKLGDGSNGTECGSIADIEEDWQGVEVAEGSTCTYDYCSQSSRENIYRCFGEGADAGCFTCTDVVHDSAVQASSKNCRAMSSADILTTKDGEKVLDKRIQCFWTRDPSIITDLSQYAGALGGVALGGVAGIAGALETAGAAEEDIGAVTNGVCAKMVIDCSKINSCNDYDGIDVKTGTGDGKLDDLNNTNFANASDEDLASVCNADPCGVAPDNRGCKADYGTGSIIFGKFQKYDCRSMADWVGN